MNVYEFGKYTSQVLPVSGVIKTAKRVYDTTGALSAAQFVAGATPLSSFAYTAAALYGAKQIYDAFT